MILIILIMLVILIMIYYSNKYETFGERTGQLCYTCTGKTFNDCNDCFNCVYCVDEYGNGQCIGGDVNSGPYNNERCKLLYNADQQMRAEQDNQVPSCSPSSFTRRIGINPYYFTNAV